MDKFRTTKFTDGDLSLDVRVSVEDGTIWLSANEIAKLFDVSIATARRVIKSTYKRIESDVILSSEKKSKNDFILHLSHKTRPITLYGNNFIIEIEKEIKSEHFEAFKNLVARNFGSNDHIENGQIVIFDNGSLSLDVTVSPKEDTVWLTQVQISLLFETSVSNVSMHIKNILNDGELDSDSVIKDFLSTAQDNKQYLVQQYNLDMILAIGYRIKGKRAIEFRKWASNILRDYMIKGYVINESRTLVTADNFLRLENEFYNLKNKIENIITNNSFAKEKIVFKGEVFDAYELICSIISKATKNVKIIDPYFDYKSLIYLKNVPSNIDRVIYKSHYSTLSLKEIHKFMSQYGNITVVENNDFHDRFIIIDDRECYSIGASLNYAGTKTFGIIKIETKELVDAILDSLN